MDYGVDNGITAGMCVHHGDLVASVVIFQCPDLFGGELQVFCVFLEIISLFYVRLTTCGSGPPVILAHQNLFKAVVLRVLG